jgi:site-specific DNA-adenine methylase
MQSRNGDMEQFNLGSDAESNEKIVSSFYRGIDKIQNVTPVLKDTTITSVDFRDVLELYQNDKQILKFIDPPYHPITRSSSALDIYPCELTIADHKEMVKILVNSNSWILCGYDPVQYGCGDYIPLEESGAKKVSMGYFHLGTSNKNGYSSEKEEFIWIKY